MTDMSDPVYKLLVQARVKLLFSRPFFGSLATRLDLVDASKWCDTAATDGRNLYYNREFIANLKMEEVMFLLGHEILHCVYDHLGRRGRRDPAISNMAQDYIVNYTLVNEKIGTMPPKGLYSEKFTDEMSSEEVYEILMKNSVEIKMPLDMHMDLQGSGNGKNQDGDGQQGGQTSVTILGGPDGPPSLTEEDLQQIRNEMRAAVLTAAQHAGAGRVPAGIKRLISELTEPVMDWRALLEMMIQSCIKDDYSFTRPSRRCHHLGVILPGQKFRDTIDVAACVDMSGSIGDKQARDFFSEIHGIMKLYGDFRLILWTFDTEVYNPKVFTPENMDEIFEYEIKGGGGTLFECNWDFMKNPEQHGFGDLFPEPIEPKKLIMFTDGLPGRGWGDPEYCDTLFIIHGSKTIRPDFGMHAYYEEK